MASPPSPKRRRKDDDTNETAAKSPEKSSPVVVFAHGAGAPSSSDWMIRWKDMLGKALNAVEVVTFDYPYMSGGKKRAPPKAEKLVDFHADFVKQTVAKYPDHPLVLAGKSMGSRVSCMVACKEDIRASAIVCLGYPLKGIKGAVRDETLLQLSIPIMFVQGSKDALCPLEKLEVTRKKMNCRSGLHVIDGGDHSFKIGKKQLQTTGSTQDQAEDLAVEAIAAFLLSAFGERAVEHVTGFIYIAKKFKLSHHLALNYVAMEQSKGRRLILFPVPLPGHIIPMLELANLLHLKGFSITIVHTHFNKLNPSSYPHLTFHLIDEGLSESEASTKDIAHLLTLLDQKCAEPLKECLISLLSDVSKEPVACLITEYRFYFTQSLAESLKLPRLLLRTGGASSLAVYIAFPLMREKGYYPKQDSQLEEPVKEFPPLKVKDLPTIKTKQNPEQFFQMTASRLIDEANASHGVIINTFEDIEGKALIRLRDELSSPIFGVGPFHKPFPTTGSSGPGCTLNLPQDQSCISWLNTQAPNSVIYVGFGSLATLSEEQFLELAWGLANSNQPFLWVVRSEFVQGSKWLEALPDKLLETLYGKGHIVKWAPQKAVLAHPAVGAFWTHCGWNSTLECISEGVPMICMPCSADQMINARYVSDVWKVGLQLDHGRERGEIEKTIRRLMVEKEGGEIRQNMSNLKEKADLCFKPGGSSYECLEGLVRHILSLEANCQRSTNSD